ncbi:hypothetical protein C8R43DRAFT_1137519 [Mycena crocata]|nr:hypothetical protein C8R43DRAFT_1137519 [Mycena crocata]
MLGYQAFVQHRVHSKSFESSPRSTSKEGFNFELVKNRCWKKFSPGSSWKEGSVQTPSNIQHRLQWIGFVTAVVESQREIYAGLRYRAFKTVHVWKLALFKFNHRHGSLDTESTLERLTLEPSRSLSNVHFKLELRLTFVFPRPFKFPSFDASASSTPSISLWISGVRASRPSAGTSNTRRIDVPRAAWNVRKTAGGQCIATYAYNATCPCTIDPPLPEFTLCGARRHIENTMFRRPTSGLNS